MCPLQLGEIFTTDEDVQVVNSTPTHIDQGPGETNRRGCSGGDAAGGTGSGAMARNGGTRVDACMGDRRQPAKA